MTVALPRYIRATDPGALRLLFPNVNFRTDIVIQDDHDGQGPYVTTWNIPDDFPSNDALDIASSRSTKLAALETLYEAKYTAGFNYNGKNFQIDPASLQNINGASSMALVSLTTSSAWPSDFVWIASDNTQMAVATAADMIAFGVASGQYVTALVMTNFALKQAIRAASTATDIDAIDITQGWPSNTL